VLAAFATTILFSISAVCGRRAAAFLGGTQANFWRLCFATVLLGIYAHLFGPGLTGASLGIFLVSGCIGFGIGDMALFQALPRIGSRLSVMLVLCLSAPMAAALEWFWLGTPLTRAEIACAIVILAGVALALSPGRGFAVPRGFLVGVLFGLVAAICQGSGAVLSRKAFATADLSGDDIDGITAAYQRILGGVLLTGIFMLLMQWRHAQVGNRAFPFEGTSDTGPSTAADPAPVTMAGGANYMRPLSFRERWRKAWALVLLNGLSGPALGVSCYQWALKTTGTGLVLPIVALTPIVIIPFSRFLEGERPTKRSLIGGAVAVLGAILLAWASSR
jgi:drug/metabolite transporter (DMT)-like permease